VVRVRVLTDGYVALDHRPRDVELPAELKRLERRPLPTRTRLHTFRDDVLLIDTLGVRAEVSGRELREEVVSAGEAASGDLLVVLADGRVCRWGTQLREVARVPKARSASVCGSGDDVLVLRPRPAWLEGMFRRGVPKWLWQLCAPRWKRRGWISPVIAADDFVIARHDYSNLICLDAATGRTRWRAPKLGSVIGVVGDRVWTSTSKTVIALDLATGDEVKRIEVLSAVPQGTIDPHGRLHLMPSSHTALDLTRDGERVDLGWGAGSGWRGLVRDNSLVFARDGRIVGASDRGDVFVVQHGKPGKLDFLRRGKDGESVFGLAAAAGRVFAYVVTLGKNEDQALEVFG